MSLRRKHIHREKGIPDIESLLFEDHEMIKRAAAECMCNLVYCEEVCANITFLLWSKVEGCLGVSYLNRSWVENRNHLDRFVKSFFKVADLFLQENTTERVKLFTLYSGEEDELLARYKFFCVMWIEFKPQRASFMFILYCIFRACSGALAIVTDNPKICEKVAEVNNNSMSSFYRPFLFYFDV